MTGEVLVGEGASEWTHYVTAGIKPSVTVVKNQYFYLGGKDPIEWSCLLTGRWPQLMLRIFLLLFYIPL